MATHIIPDDNGKGFTIASIGGDVEYADPIKYFSERCIEPRVAVFLKTLEIKMPGADKDTMMKVALKNATEVWDEHYKEKMSTQIPDALFALLKSTSKGEQVKLLKGLQLTPESL